MKKFLVLLIISLSSFSVFSATDLKLVFDLHEVNQGELVHARLLVPMSQMQELNISKLENNSLNEMIYFMEVSPVVKREGRDDLEADVKVVFTKVPEARSLVGKVNGVEVSLTWNQIEVKPTEGSQELLFGSFEIPKKSKLVIWTLLGLLGLIVILLATRFVLEKHKQKKAQKIKMINLRDELLGCREFEEVVKVWQHRQDYFSYFPHIIEPFKKLEKELYKHQFKPKQSEQEKIEVMDAYRTFKRSVEGGFIGI